MKSFLNKIAQLSSVQQVLLMDLEGDPLYSFPSVAANNGFNQFGGVVHVDRALEANSVAVMKQYIRDAENNLDELEDATATVGGEVTK